MTVLTMIPLHSAACTPDNIADGCFVYDGKMRLYLKSGANSDIAIYQSRLFIQNLLSQVGSITTTGLVKATYLAPALNTPNAAQTTATQGSNIASANNSLSTGGIAITVSATLLVVLLAVVLSVRYRRRTAEKNSNLTVAQGSDITGNSSLGGANATQQSSFSAILPRSYRLQNEMNMSAILEGDSDSGSQRGTSDIIISESGYTTDENSLSSSVPYTNAQLHSFSTSPVLGARKMADEDDDDLIFDTGSDVAAQSVEPLETP